MENEPNLSKMTAEIFSFTSPRL